MAIRREDQSLWERRAPLGPQHVRKLIKEGVKVIVQPSNRRAYPMQVIITIKVTKSLGITMRIGCAEWLIGLRWRFLSHVRDGRWFEPGHCRNFYLLSFREF